MRADQLFRKQIEQKQKQAQELLNRLKTRHAKKNRLYIQGQSAILPVQLLNSPAKQKDSYIEILDWFQKAFNMKADCPNVIIKTITETINQFAQQNEQQVQNVQEILSLKNTKQELQKRLSQQISVNSANKQRIRTLNQEIQSVQSRNKQLWERYQDLMREHGSIANQLSQQRRLKKQLNQQHINYKQKILALQQMILQKDDQIDKINSQVEQTFKKSKTQNNKTQQLQGSLQLKQQQNCCFKNGQINKQQTVNEQQIIHSCNIVSQQQLINQITTLRHKLEQNESQIKDLVQQTYNLNKCKLQIRNKLLSIVNDIQTFQQNERQYTPQLIQKIRQYVTKMRQMNEVSIKQNSILAQQLSSLKKANQTSINAQMEQTDLIQQLQTQLATKTEQIHQLIIKYQEKIKHYQKQIETQKDKAQQLQEQFQNQRSLYQDSLVNVKKLETELGLLYIQLQKQNLSQQSQLLDHSNSNIEKENPEFSHSLSNKEDLICQLTENLNRKQQKIIQMETVMNNLRLIKEKNQISDEQLKQIQKLQLQNEILLQQNRKLVENASNYTQVMFSNKNDQKHIQNIQLLNKQLSCSYEKINDLTRQLHKIKQQSEIIEDNQFIKAIKSKQQPTRNPIFSEKKQDKQSLNESKKDKQSPTKQKKSSKSKSISKIASYFGF